MQDNDFRHPLDESQNRIENKDSLCMTPEDMQIMMDIVSDPTGSRRSLDEQIDQTNDLKNGLDDGLQAYKEQHRHDTRNKILLALFSAIFGTVCTIIAARCGWLS